MVRLLAATVHPARPPAVRRPGHLPAAVTHRPAVIRPVATSLLRGIRRTVRRWPLRVADR